MKKYVCLALITAILFGFCGCGKPEIDVSAEEKPTVNLLLLGLDEAAQNTDEIAVLSINEKENRVTVLQIPRDTFLTDGNTERKINSLYSVFRAKGLGPSEALSELQTRFSDLFGIPLTMTGAVTFSGVRAAVDAVGGVSVNFPSEIELDGKTYCAGEHGLNGEEALSFVRYRSGYLMGDLSRLDAQKLFLHAFISKVKTLSAGEFLSLVKALRGSLVLSLTTENLLSLWFETQKTVKNGEIRYLTCPGEGVYKDGISYFVLNKKGTETVLSSFGKTGEFDRDGVFYDHASVGMHNVYFDDNPDVSVYTDMSVGTIEIKKKLIPRKGET